MTTDQEKKYREEFEKLEVLYTPHPMEGERDYFAKNSEGNYRWSHIREDWQVYLAARKKAQGEIEELKNEVDFQKEVRTAQSEMIKIKISEIKDLKAEIEKRDKLLEQAKIRIEQFKEFVRYHDNKHFENHIALMGDCDSFIKEVEELR